VADPDPSFVDLFNEEYPRLLRSLALVTGDRESAADVVQEAFVQLLVRWSRISGYDRPDAWVRRVAIRRALKVRAKESRLMSRLALAAPIVAAEPGVERVDLARALGQLSPSQRAAVVLHYLDDLPVADVADALNCRESTARVHLFRARTRLAELLGETVEP
jgi:RNA polymerase sigma-70 factor (ECF subfamily)